MGRGANAEGESLVMLRTLSELRSDLSTRCLPLKAREVRQSFEGCVCVCVCAALGKLQKIPLFDCAGGGVHHQSAITTRAWLFPDLDTGMSLGPGQRLQHGFAVH